MGNPLADLLSARDWILADGATGTTLFNMGLESGDAPELWNVDHPDRIDALYSGAVEAGSDLFLTNSFGANAARLKLHGAESRAGELARVSAEIGRGVADRAGRKVIVAGSMGPTGEIMAPMGALSMSDAVAIFHEQAEGLKAGGADLLWVETISAADEFRAAAEAARLAGMPWCGTMSFDTAGRTMMGLSPGDLVTLADGLAHPPLAFGANCGVGASDLLRTVLGFAAQGPERPVIAKGNAGIPKYVDGHIHYDGTPALMARYATLAIAARGSSAAAAAPRPRICVACARRWNRPPPERGRASRRSRRNWAAFPRRATGRVPMHRPAPAARGGAGHVISAGHAQHTPLTQPRPPMPRSANLAGRCGSGAAVMAAERTSAGAGTASTRRLAPADVLDRRRVDRAPATAPRGIHGRRSFSNRRRNWNLCASPPVPSGRSPGSIRPRCRPVRSSPLTARATLRAD